MEAQKSARDEEFRAFAGGVWSRLYRSAYLLAGERHGAEDLVQQAMERAYVAWGRVRAADDPYAYVCRILINEHARRFRRRRPPEQLVTDVPDRPAPAGPDTEDRAALLAALGTLPPGQRQAVVLRYWEDLSETQTAAAMGCSVGTVKSQAARGLAKLRGVSSLSGLTNVGGGR
ncbi:SigE family RNA polymerase sigma factor [Streptomyces sp. NRRL WC-3742]|uniref:SigE family RNA polymerase sigma factor n=1 Tax=Streptomyces sp. NRRL WC-3742 TaxID=1463934 RepID=UPI0004C90061|nr:SigE family RNA polymerase sigma factor [Streptomyces sp. NRRL WC-3742]